MARLDVQGLKELHKGIFNGETTMIKAANSVPFIDKNGVKFTQKRSTKTLATYFQQNNLRCFHAGRKGFKHPINPITIGYICTKYEELGYGINAMYEFCLSQNITVSHEEVYEIYKSNMPDFKPKIKKPKKERVRYVASHTNAIWHGDIHELNFFGETRYLYALIDDCSRYIVGYSLNNTKESKHCIDTLNKAIRDYGQPGAYFADNGKENVSEAMKNFLSNREFEIDLINTIPGNPEQNGKIEKWWQPLDK